ncbi:MAG: type III-B CRISPR module RAMP protein Cmr1 [Chloroflexi bacterium]|nr:type III-B CRISPR module RAMP protein Cmr1 [Chloroflexota bacterium]MBU1746201.1 type III-B CRISPR module RAMP protein Cmr1 [Chloroflexota bacterium]
MPEPIRIQLRTLTPLWTGGVETGKMDRIHETGLIGSLRWWYEALVRGMRGEACDPTEHACSYDAGKPNHGLCSACHLFGATGWSRRFRLVVQDTTQPDGDSGSRQPTGKRFKRGATNERPSWYFTQGRGGTITVSLIPLATDFDPQVVVGLFKLIEQHAGLAAKTQLGYGWIRLVQPPPFDEAGFVQAVQTAAAAKLNSSEGLPALSEMFFAQIGTSDPALTAMLNLKYDVRAAFRSAFGGDQTLRHFVCGAVRGNQRQAAKVFFSQVVDDTMRVWGWIPNALPISGITRDQVVDQIKTTISQYGPPVRSWREYNSPRDTMTPLQTDRAAFLASLLQEGGERWP